MPTGESLPSLQRFRELMRRIRAGDAEATTELVRRYEPAIHKAIRVPLSNFRLHAVLESHDISQTVLGQFFGHKLAVRLKLEHPEELVKLLVTMARNTVRDEARKHKADRRDRRRQEHGPGHIALETVVDTRPAASRVAAGKELLEEVYRRLTEEERWLAEQRADGLGWDVIAALRSRPADALRKQLARALHRVNQQLDLAAAFIA